MSPPNAVAHVAEMIRARFGLDFGGMRLAVLFDGLCRLDPDPEAAAQALIRADRERFADFVGSVTNSETYFFRHAEQFAAVGVLLQRQWLAQPPASFRVWCAGCASGEEPLTVSAVLEDVCSLVPRHPAATILATDISPGALRRAQQGDYSEWSFRGVLSELRARHFTREDGANRPRSSLRDRITFRRHNLLDESPEPVPFELVVCRNVLIYFDPRTFELALNRLAIAVAPGGLLVLGPVESAAAKLPDFEMLHPGSCVIYRKRSIGAALPVPAGWTSSALSQARPSRPSAPPPPPRQNPAPPPPWRPDGLVERLAEARALADQGLLKEARAVAGALRRAHGDAGEVRILFALIHLEEGNRDAATAELEAAITAQPELAMAHYLLGSIFDGAGARTEAEELYRSALHAVGDAAPRLPVAGGGGLTAEELVSALTHLLGLTPEVTA